LPQPTAASSATAALASRKSRHLDLIIRFNLQLINLIAFYSYFRSICAVIKAFKNLKYLFMYFFLLLKYIHLWVFCILFGFSLFIIDNLQI
jgi:hypothetical protein